MDVDKEDEGNDVVMKDVNEEYAVKKERTALTRLPVAKVKNIFKLDWDNKLGQKNSYVVIAKMTELFLNELAKSVHAVCKRAKRKTMNIEDIAAVVKGNEGKYGFVDIGSLFYVDVFHNKKSKSANTRGGNGNINNIVNTNNNNTRTTATKLPKQHQHNVNNNNRTIESMFQMKQQQQ